MSENDIGNMSEYDETGNMSEYDGIDNMSEYDETDNMSEYDETDNMSEYDDDDPMDSDHGDDAVSSGGSQPSPAGSNPDMGTNEPSQAPRESVPPMGITQSQLVEFMKGRVLNIPALEDCFRQWPSHCSSYYDAIHEEMETQISEQVAPPLIPWVCSYQNYRLT